MSWTGQDVRQLALDGVPLSYLYGADVLLGFGAVGYSLFRDCDRFDSSYFITGDIFSEVDDFAKTRGCWDIVHVGMFLHILSLGDQETACRKIMQLPQATPGAMIVGTQTGSLNAEETVLKRPLCEPGEHKSRFRQSKETMRDMWKRAAEELRIEVNVWTGYDDNEPTERAQGRKRRGEE